MTERSAESWSRSVASAGAALEPAVRPALESLARARWGGSASGRWRVISNTAEASWVLARFLSRDDDGTLHYARIQVVATVDPRGQLVTWQVNNGAEFLGLTDLSTYGLQRGVLYLLDQEYREWVTHEPLFDDAVQGLGDTVRSFWHRLRRPPR